VDGEPVEYRGKYFSFGKITMLPKPVTPGGPPIWVGGRAEGALKRAARLGDGWMPYVVTPKRVADGLDFIAREAERLAARIDRFGTRGPSVSWTLGPTYEQALDVAAEILSKRYAMDFREPAKKYAAVGKPGGCRCAKSANSSRPASATSTSHVISHPKDRDAQLEQFGREVISDPSPIDSRQPLLVLGRCDLRGVARYIRRHDSSGP